MANAIPPPRVYQCLIYLKNDGWVRGECYKNPIDTSRYLVRIEPIPASIHEEYREQGLKPYFATICMLQVPVDDPNLRVILNDEVTYT